MHFCLLLLLSHRFIPSNYQRFQLMRFSVEEINNSSSLLPNLSLGYEVFDHCSDTLSFPGVLRLMSVNGFIQPWAEPNNKVSRVLAVIGPFTSTQAMTVAPFFMPDLIPMVGHLLITQENITIYLYYFNLILYYFSSYVFIFLCRSVMVPQVLFFQVK